MQTEQDRPIDGVQESIWPPFLQNASTERDQPVWTPFSEVMDRLRAPNGNQIDRLHEVPNRSVGSTSLKRQLDHPSDSPKGTKRVTRSQNAAGKTGLFVTPPAATAPASQPGLAAHTRSITIPKTSQHVHAEHAASLATEASSSQRPTRSSPHLRPTPAQRHPRYPSTSHPAPALSNATPSTSILSPSDRRGTKPKRLKAHTVSTKTFNIPLIPRDVSGLPYLPLNVGIFTVISLGEICPREHFHTERYIYPVGYEITRRYLSTVDPTSEAVYHCTIVDGGDGPKFQITPADAPDAPVIAGSASGAWTPIVRRANALRHRAHSNTVSGPDYFGLGANTIKHLIQALPGSERLRDYIWQNFVEGGPMAGRYATVTPVLPEDLSKAVPRGAYKPTQHETHQHTPHPSSSNPAPPIRTAPGSANINIRGPSAGSESVTPGGSGGGERRSYYRSHVLAPVTRAEGGRYAGYPPVNGQRIVFDTPTPPQPPQVTRAPMAGLLHDFPVDPSLGQVRPAVVLSTNALNPPPIFHTSPPG